MARGFSRRLLLGRQYVLTRLRQLGRQRYLPPNYVIISMVSNTQFTIKLTPDIEGHPNIPNGVLGGSFNAIRHATDIFSHPGTVPFASAYTLSPQTLRFSSRGNLVLAESAYKTARLIALNNADGPAANTITRIGCAGNEIGRMDTVPIGGWTWLDVDRAGKCGPVDDIIYHDKQFAASHASWRMSLSFTSVPGIPAYYAFLRTARPDLCPCSGDRRCSLSWAHLLHAQPDDHHHRHVSRRCTAAAADPVVNGLISIRWITLGFNS